MGSTEADLLRSINADLPEGVDWKQGAITYLRELVTEGGEGQEWFHLLKPFLGGPDYAPFWVDVFEFLDVVQAARLAPSDVVIDVGCGPGWTVQWLAKLGHQVVGLDISAELLDIAERRMQTDPYPPYLGKAFRYDLRVHDIEAEPLDLAVKARLALFESTLHHFYNPVAALRNTVTDLAEDGIVAVIEAAAPPKGSEWDVQNVEIMRRYHTIERPYTRAQLLDMLDLAGLPYVSFLRPVNGLFAQHVDGLAPLSWELTRADNINIFLASPPPAGSNGSGFRRAPSTRRDPAGPRWTALSPSSDGPTAPGSAGADRGSSSASTRPAPTPRSWPPSASLRDRVQAVRLVTGSAVGELVTLTQERPSATLTLTGASGQLVELHSDRVFSPCWDGGDDPRLLSFTVDEPT